jgi:hypothetical protein
MPGQRLDELKCIVDLAHSVYRKQFGRDVLSSGFQVRYINSTNVRRLREITSYGDLSDFHLDQRADFTCIVYLCAVTRETGCFSYIDGTSSLHKSHLLRALHGVVSFDMNLPTPDQVTDLPLELRGGIGIGNFLDDEKCARLAHAQVDVVGNAGDGIIFNGFDTLHRGGKPTNGERTALLISTAGWMRMRVKRHVRQLLAYLWL